MTEDELIVGLSDQITLAATAYGEARAVPRNDPDSHSPVEELIAVMVVVRNRLKRSTKLDDTYKSICLAHAQFSCWTPNSGANHTALIALLTAMVAGQPVDPLFEECLFLANGVIGGQILDRTGGATSYWAPAAMMPPGRVPGWAQGKTTLQIGDQLFL